MDMRPLQRVKEHSSLEVGEVPKSLRLLVTTALDGANWMLYNQHEIAIVQSWMAIRFMSLEDIKQGKPRTFKSIQPSWKIFKVIFEVYRNLERQWRFKKHQVSWSETRRLYLVSWISSGWYKLLCQSVNNKKQAENKNDLIKCKFLFS